MGIARVDSCQPTEESWFFGGDGGFSVSLFSPFFRRGEVINRDFLSKSVLARFGDLRDAVGSVETICGIAPILFRAARRYSANLFVLRSGGFRRKLELSRK